MDGFGIWFFSSLHIFLIFSLELICVFVPRDNEKVTSGRCVSSYFTIQSRCDWVSFRLIQCAYECPMFISSLLVLGVFVLSPSPTSP